MEKFTEHILSGPIYGGHSRIASQVSNGITKYFFVHRLLVLINALGKVNPFLAFLIVFNNCWVVVGDSIK